MHTRRKKEIYIYIHTHTKGKDRKRPSTEEQDAGAGHGRNQLPIARDVKPPEGWHVPPPPSAALGSLPMSHLRFPFHFSFPPSPFYLLLRPITHS